MDPSVPASSASDGTTREAQMVAALTAIEQRMEQLQQEVREVKTQLAAEQETVQSLTTQLAALTQVKSRVAAKEEHIALSKGLGYKCESCDALLDPSNWFRCHECEDCNFCRACFETETFRHARGTHSFTDMAALPRVVNKREKHAAILQHIAVYVCCGCSTRTFPQKDGWFRCNMCKNYDLCCHCWDKEYPKHAGGSHTFTDIATTFYNKCDFPTIENKKEWFGKSPNLIVACNNCAKLVNKRFFHCNQCPHPGYDLCDDCMATTNAWRTHSGPDSDAHTFTDVYELVNPSK